MWRMRFEWDPEKNRINQQKHGVSFEEAVRVFDAEDEALDLFDERHSDSEDRFITIGPIRGGLVLVVWTERMEDVIRVISARWATPGEKRLYRRHMEHRQ
jgi:uncharacterized DUF497 family protein